VVGEFRDANIDTTDFTSHKELGTELGQMNFQLLLGEGPLLILITAPRK
jgi:hypothetical protein